ncbi:MAG: DUF4340 domain-containing protein [Thiotrichales bacterium]|nr:DUF4340 domain-containing protein [Thiotrichales bacterium]
MRGARAVPVLGLVTLVAVGAVLFVERGSDTPEPGGDIVFPALLEQVNSVARVRVTGNEGTFTLTRDGDTWVVEDKERYRADPDRVHKLLLGAAGMKRIEPKTSNPERYPKLWLEDPTDEDAKSVGFVLEDTSGAVLADWVLGNRRPSKSDASRTELYIRVADDPQAWLVEGSVPGGGKTIDWLDRVVAHIERERLRTTEVSHADGAVVAVTREALADRHFGLRDVPEGRELDSQYRVNDIGRFLEDLRFEDVAPASSLDFVGSVDKRLEITTFDGLRVHLDSVLRDDNAWVRLRAEVDVGLVGQKAIGGAGNGTVDGTIDGVSDEAEVSAGDGEPGAESKNPPEPLLPLDAVRTEAERLNARWQGWAYELPSFKRDYIARRMDTLTRTTEDPDPQAGGSDS